MNKKDQKPYRSLRDVSYDELQQAVIKMVLGLGISGSGTGYSLYEAVRNEKEKVTPPESLGKIDD